MTDPTPHEIEARITREFGASASEARVALATIDLGDWLIDRTRVEVAVVELAEGDLAELRRLVDAANLDWRDVLYWQERRAGTDGPP